MAESEKPSMDALKQSMQAWVSKEIEASYEKHGKEVCAAFGAQPSAYNQATNAVVIARSLREVDKDFAPKSKGGRFTDEQWSRISGILYKGGNASANRQALEAKKTNAIAAKLLAADCS